MKNMRFLTLSMASVWALSACSSVNNLTSRLPSRAPDYRQSTVGRSIEAPPDLTRNNLGTQLEVKDFHPSAITSYNDLNQLGVKKNKRGYIEVLPELYGVSIDHTADNLPYITIDLDANTAWTWVSEYWANNGVRLAISEPAIGVMETDWLENKSSLPQTGITGFISGVLGFLHDSDQRDRYRIRFTRVGDKTQILLIYSMAEQEAERDFQSGKDPAGFTWKLSDNKNPEMQLEMTRRLALYLSLRLENQQQGASQLSDNNALGSQKVAFLSMYEQQPSIQINLDYAQSWRTLGIALDKASFSVESSQLETGTYRVRYAPQSDEKASSFFVNLWDKNKSKTRRPQYLIRLADKGNYTIAVVQNLSGQAVSKEEANTVLQTLYSAF